MIYVTGDIHGAFEIDRLSTENFPEQKNLSRSDHVIICGDFGCVWTGDNEDDRLLDWLDGRSFTTLFVDGNHENFVALERYPTEQWHGGKVQFLRPNVIHLMRGQVYEIDSHTFFAMGGAASTDREHRIEGRSWWAQEMPSEEEYAEAERNLARYGYCVDYVLTHTAPFSLIPFLVDFITVPDRLTRYLDGLSDRVLFRRWFFGHLHVDKNILKYSALHKSIVPLTTEAEAEYTSCAAAGAPAAGDTADSAAGDADTERITEFALPEIVISAIETPAFELPEEEPSAPDSPEEEVTYPEAPEPEALEGSEPEASEDDEPDIPDCLDITTILRSRDHTTAEASRSGNCIHIQAAKSCTAEEDEEDEDDDDIEYDALEFFGCMTFEKLTALLHTLKRCIFSDPDASSDESDEDESAVCGLFGSAAGEARADERAHYKLKAGTVPSFDAATAAGSKQCTVEAAYKADDKTTNKAASPKRPGKREAYDYDTNSFFTSGSSAFDFRLFLPRDTRPAKRPAAAPPLLKDSATGKAAARRSANMSKSEFFRECLFCSTALVLLVGFLEIAFGVLTFIERATVPSLFPKSISPNGWALPLLLYIGTVHISAMFVKKRSRFSAFLTSALPLLLGFSVLAVCIETSLALWLILFAAILLLAIIIFAIFDYLTQNNKPQIRLGKGSGEKIAAKLPGFWSCLSSNYSYFKGVAVLSLVCFLVISVTTIYPAQRYEGRYTLTGAADLAVKPISVPNYITDVTPNSDVYIPDDPSDNPYLDELGQINPHQWGSLTCIQRMNALQAVINTELSQMGFGKSLSVRCTRLEEGIDTLYDSGRFCITVNDDLLMGDDLPAVLHSTLRELRSAYQLDRVSDLYSRYSARMYDQLDDSRREWLWLVSAARYASLNPGSSLDDCLEQCAPLLESDAESYAEIYTDHYLWLGSSICVDSGIASEFAAELSDGTRLTLHFYTDQLAVFHGSKGYMYRLVNTIKMDREIDPKAAAASARVTILPGEEESSISFNPDKLCTVRYTWDCSLFTL